MKEAMFYEKMDNGRVKCVLCNHFCVISIGKRGICGVRENRDGILYSLVYNKAISVAIDPIEKKPFFHFYPGTTSYSFATVGCNFKCLHCQNWEISQDSKEPSGHIAGRELEPRDIVREAREYGCRSIAYTYTEPTIFFEYAFETAKLATEAGLKNVFVSNGYTSQEAIRKIEPYLDGVNVDIKGFTEEFYLKFCGGKLQIVLDNVRLYRELGIWVEITTLIIPTLNDSVEQLRGIASFIKSVDGDIPWHVTAFHPEYKLMDIGSTPLETLRMARGIGLDEGLKYVYTGNIPGEGGENTLCPGCGRNVISRVGFNIYENEIEKGKCPGCKTHIAGRGM